MASDKNNLERVSPDSPNQDLDTSSSSENLFFETLRQKTQKLAGILPFTLIELFNPTHLQSSKETSSQPVNPTTHLEQPLIPTPQENILSPVELQEGEVDTTISFPPDRTIENIKEDAFVILAGPPGGIQIRGIENLNVYLKQNKIDTLKNVNLDSLRLNFIGDLYYPSLGITGEEDMDTLKAKVEKYFGADTSNDENILFSGLGPIYGYTKDYGYEIIEGAIGIYWKLEKINILILDKNKERLYVQFTSKPTPKSRINPNGGGWIYETQEQTEERLRKMLELITSGDPRGIVWGMALNSGARYRGWNSRVIRVPCVDPALDKHVGANQYPAKYAPLVWLDIFGTIEYTPPDTTGAPGDSTGTNPNITRPELPQDYKMLAIPNPVEAGKPVTIMIEIPRRGKYEAVIFDILGREVGDPVQFWIEQDNTVQIIRLSTLLPDGRALRRGVYYARVRSIANPDNRFSKATPFTITPQNR